MVIAAVALAAACSAVVTQRRDAGRQAAPIAAIGPATSAAPVGPTGRPFEVFLPRTYDPLVPAPLVLLLHGWGGDGAGIESALDLRAYAEMEGFLYGLPNGTRDPGGRRFWNATDACCNIADLPVDDSAYLEGVIDAIAATYAVDPDRVYLVGASNGGFMSYRMACDHADRVAAIVSLAGATFGDPTRCTPSTPVSVLQVHGTSDQVVGYRGGELLPGTPFPGAEATVATWATYNGCGSLETDRARLDLDPALPDAETSVTAYAECPRDGAVELWTVGGGGHTLAPTPALTTAIVRFLLGHPKS
jgi:polyhydroxybutyrate depolymerase